MPICGNCFRENPGDVCPDCGWDARDAEQKFPLALKPGFILNGRYIVGRVLGQGGFGITYLALDDMSKTRFAIKEYFPTEFAGRSAPNPAVRVYSARYQETFAYGRAQFLEEAKTLAALNGSEHFVRIYSYFEENDTAYFTMEYIEGQSLGAYIRSRGGRLTPEEACRLLLPLAEAMELVHQRGIIHRDITPGNIVVTPHGTAKLIDFGAARYSTGEMSKSLDVILKHGFAPYEQYMRRGRQGPWTDVYSLAATFYFAVTGQVPPEAVERRQGDTLLPPRALGVSIDAAMEAALMKALQVQASDRFQSMEQFARAMREKAPRPGQEPPPAPAAPREKSRPARMRLGLGLLLALILFLVGARFAAPPLLYHSAQAHLESGEPRLAYAWFRRLKNYRDAGERAAQIVADLREAGCIPLAAGSDHSAALRADGTVLAAGSNENGQCEVSAWRDVVSVSAGHRHTVGLRSDGTVLAAGLNLDGRCSTEGWTEIVAISAGGTHTVGLRADGTVVAVGFNGERQCDVSDWSDIVMIAAGGGHTVGLRADGTVVAAGGNDYGQCDVSGWTEIVSVAAGYFHTVGLRADGTVVAVGNNDFGQCALADWAGIAAVEAGNWQTVGLRRDRTLVAAGQDSDGQCSVSDWTDVLACATGGRHTIALRGDGSVVAVGNNESGQCAVSGWQDIKTG